MRNAKSSTSHPRALVYHNIQDLLQTVDPNALAITNVPVIKHVSTKNVQTHVLEHAVQMRNVTSLVTRQIVCVIIIILGTHSFNVCHCNVRKKSNEIDRPHVELVTNLY